MAQEDQDLLCVGKAKKIQSSLRVTIPKGVVHELGLGDGDYIGYYKSGSGIVIRKIR